MPWLIRFAKSSIGAKVVMAISGGAILLFVLVHMAGNLQIYMGQDAYNAYAYFLKSKPALVWTARLGLLVMVSLHVASGLRLALLNRAARPQAYAVRRYTRATWSSRSMAISGLCVLSFIVYHLLHFTLGVTDPANYHLVDSAGRHDVFTMFVRGFQQPAVAISYMVAMVLLGLHLEHGASSMFQTLGLNHARYNRVIGKIGPALATLIVLGNVSMPAAVLLGIIH